MNLAKGAPTAVELWMYQGVKSLLKALEAGAGLIIGDAGVKAYLVFTPWKVVFGKLLMCATGLCGPRIQPIG